MFGTLVEIQAYSEDSENFQKAVHQIELMFAEMHKEWHAWKGDGELARLNQALSNGESFTASPDLLALLEQASAYSRQSEGMFNPAIGKLIGRWGFHSDEPPSGPPPTEALVAELVKAAPEMQALEFDANRISSKNPEVQLDLGAFAKGVALNLAIQRLAEYGIQDAIVNAGGDLCASGSHGERPWKIGIRNPFKSGVIASLALADGECVLTSGNYERYLEHEGVRYTHIINPRSGYPVAHVASATVVHPDGGLADAAATALSVAGPVDWRRIAEGMSVDQAMLVDEEGGVHLTPKMRARVQLTEAPIP